MPMKSPPHPGHSIKDACLEPLGLSIVEGATALGVTRPTLSRVINGKAAISPEMAIRLSKAFGGSPDAWLKMQVAYDLSRALEKADDLDIVKYEPRNTNDSPHVWG